MKFEFKNNKKVEVVLFGNREKALIGWIGNNDSELVPTLVRTRDVNGMGQYWDGTDPTAPSRDGMGLGRDFRIFLGWDGTGTNNMGQWDGTEMGQKWDDDPMGYFRPKEILCSNRLINMSDMNNNADSRVFNYQTSQSNVKPIEFN